MVSADTSVYADNAADRRTALQSVSCVWPTRDGVPLPAGSISYQALHSRLDLTPSTAVQWWPRNLRRLRLQHADHGAIIIAPWCRHTFIGLSLAALQSWVSCALYDVSFRRLSVYQTLVVALVLSQLDYGNAPSCLPTQPSAVRPPRRSSVDRRSSSLGPHHWRSSQFSLAPSAWLYQV